MRKATRADVWDELRYPQLPLRTLIQSRLNLSYRVTEEGFQRTESFPQSPPSAGHPRRRRRGSQDLTPTLQQVGPSTPCCRLSRQSSLSD